MKLKDLAKLVNGKDYGYGAELKRLYINKLTKLHGGIKKLLSNKSWTYAKDQD